MNRSAISTCLSACLFLLILSAWTTWLMLHFGSDVLKWLLSTSFLYTHTLALSAVNGLAWVNQLNVICWLLVFVTGGLLATLLTGMVIRSGMDTLQACLNVKRRQPWKGMSR